MKKPFLWMVVACATPLMAAQPPTKAPWQWTIEERLAARCDDAARNRRIAEFEAKRAAKRAEMAGRSRQPLGDFGASRPADSIHGSDHPELLMPFEIVNVFTQAAFGADDETARVIRKDAAKKARALGLPETFVDDFERAAHTFIAEQREELRLLEHAYAGTDGDRARTEARLQELRTLECRSRAEAIRHLQKAFGKKFERFLYSAIAPSVSRDIFEPITAEQLRHQEEGCQ